VEELTSLSGIEKATRVRLSPTVAITAPKPILHRSREKIRVQQHRQSTQPFSLRVLSEPKYRFSLPSLSSTKIIYCATVSQARGGERRGCPYSALFYCLRCWRGKDLGGQPFPCAEPKQKNRSQVWLLAVGVSLRRARHTFPHQSREEKNNSEKKETPKIRRGRGKQSKWRRPREKQSKWRRARARSNP